MKKSRKPFIYLLVLLGLIAIGISSCFQFRMTDKRQISKLRKAGVDGEVGFIQALGRNIHFTLAGRDSSKPLVMIIHGSPGSSSNFLAFAEDSTLLSKYQVLLVDRPGFGYSDFGKAEASIIKQAAILNEVWPKFASTGVLLAGHSLGGPIVARMAMDSSAEIEGIMLVSASVSPELEPEEKWRKTIAKRWINWLVPKSLRASNEEIMPAKAELETMRDLWKEISVPVVILHGEKDKLVPVGNADYAKKMLVNSSEVRTIKYPNLNHFIPFGQTELMVKELMSFPED